MNFRYARHTNNLAKIEIFYTTIVGLQRLGGFEAHAGYDGVFLGLPALNWHLEFTTSSDKVIHKFDDDDILVFYLQSVAELEEVKQRIKENAVPIEQAKNPYWNHHGLMITDPDGHKIVFSLKN